MNSFVRISEAFEKMIEEKVIDTEINKELMKLNETMEGMKKDIIKKNGIIEEDFTLFFSLDVQQKILKRMIEKIYEAKIKMENPKIAKQIMLIIPTMFYVYSLVEEFIKRNEVLIKNEIIKLSFELQNLALDQDLFIRKDQSKEELNKKNIEIITNSFPSGIGDYF